MKSRLGLWFYGSLLGVGLGVVAGCGGVGSTTNPAPSPSLSALSTPVPSTRPSPLHAGFAKGADVSWVTQMEAAGYTFKNDAGETRDLFQILKSHGINAIRLRVWVNPTGGWNGIADTVAKAVRAKNAGMDVMIDFHYSDSWADPGQQRKPAAWLTYDLNSLYTAVEQHTQEVCEALKTAGVTPKWVQVGNETNNGMLWGYWDKTTNKNITDGQVSLVASSGHFPEYAQFVTKGCQTVKKVFPQCLVIVHLANGNDNGLYTWNIGGLINAGAQFDIIGMSLYPDPYSNWATYNSQCLSNMNDMIARYGKSVMICEVGMDYTQGPTCKAFITDLMNKVNSVSNRKGLGVFYWEPECYGSWPTNYPYTNGAWGTNGRPTEALDAFLMN